MATTEQLAQQIIDQTIQSKNPWWQEYSYSTVKTPYGTPGILSTDEIGTSAGDIWQTSTAMSNWSQFDQNGNQVYATPQISEDWKKQYQGRQSLLDSISNTIYIGSDGAELALKENDFGAAKLLNFCWDGKKLLIQVSKELLPNIILDIRPEDQPSTGQPEKTPTKSQDPF